MLNKECWSEPSTAPPGKSEAETFNITHSFHPKPVADAINGMPRRDRAFRWTRGN